MSGRRTKREPLTADQIEVGKVYRARRFREFLGETNDRVVVWISPTREKVQYDSDTVRLGAHYPTVTMQQFLNWASHEIAERGAKEVADDEKG